MYIHAYYLYIYHTIAGGVQCQSKLDAHQLQTILRSLSVSVLCISGRKGASIECGQKLNWVVVFAIGSFCWVLLIGFFVSTSYSQHCTSMHRIEYCCYCCCYATTVYNARQHLSGEKRARDEQDHCQQEQRERKGNRETKKSQGGEAGVGERRNKEYCR